MLSLLALTLTLSLSMPQGGGTPAGKPVPDMIRLADGHTLTGRIISETKDELRIRVGRGAVEVARRDVIEVRSIERSLADFIRRWDEMPRTDRAALAELVRFCESRGLFGEARNLWLRILILDPHSREAAQALGATPYGDSWQLNTGRSWMPLSNYLAAKPRWTNAVDLTTAHFLVHTDLALDKILDATVQLERHYLRFYAMLGPELGLYVFAEVPEVNVYSNSQNYPAPPQMGEESWFAFGANQLHVLVHEPLDLFMLQRDVTEMLLYNAFRQSSGHNGEIQPWAARGLAEYFAATAGKKVGDPWAPLGTPSQLLFDRELQDPNPLPLYRLMNTARSEFRSGPDGERRSVYAYTFMHFLLNGNANTYREGFFEYLRKAWLGAGGAGLLYQTLGIPQDKLEARWYQHVQAVANSR